MSSETCLTRNTRLIWGKKMIQKTETEHLIGPIGDRTQTKVKKNVNLTGENKPTVALLERITTLPKPYR